MSRTAVTAPHPALLALAAATIAVLAAAPAQAQPGFAGPPAPAAPPPSTLAPDGTPSVVDWSQVSNINGQLVKIGEKSDYLYDQRKTVISTNPVGLVLGMYSVSVTHAVNRNVAIRGDVGYIKPFDTTDVSMTEVGFGVPIYLKRTYSGPFLEPGVIYRSSRDGGATSVEAGPQMLFGWGVYYDSGLSLSMAFGVGRDLVHDQSEFDDTGSDDAGEPFPNGYFRVGYGF